MNKYKKDLESIKVSEEFKETTKRILIEKLNRKNSIDIKKNKRNKSLAITAAILIIFIGGTVVIKYTGNKFILAKEQNSSTKVEAGEKGETNFNEESQGELLERSDDEESTPPIEFIPREDLPILSINYNSGDGMGYAVLMAYSIEELDNGNPWKEDSSINHLPVFENIGKLNEGGNPTGTISKEEMKNIVEDTARAFGFSIDSYEENHRSIVAKCGEVEICVGSDGSIEISFLTPVKLPSNIIFGYGNRVKNREDAETATNYLVNKYKEAIGFKEPAVDVGHGDYRSNGERVWQYDCYEGDGDLTSEILAYNFKKVSFIPDDFGNLIMIRVHSKDISKVMGDYPIISKEEAMKLLVGGNYSTTVKEVFPGEDYVKKVELIYNTDSYNEVFMPFYKFYVEIPTFEQDNGLKSYGIYTVPAVKGKYLKELPTAVIKFN